MVMSVDEIVPFKIFLSRGEHLPRDIRHFLVYLAVAEGSVFMHVV